MPLRCSAAPVAPTTLPLPAERLPNTCVLPNAWPKGIRISSVLVLANITSTPSDSSGRSRNVRSPSMRFTGHHRLTSQNSPLLFGPIVITSPIHNSASSSSNGSTKTIPPDLNTECGSLPGSSGRIMECGGKRNATSLCLSYHLWILSGARPVPGAPLRPGAPRSLTPTRHSSLVTFPPYRFHTDFGNAPTPRRSTLPYAPRSSSVLHAPLRPLRPLRQAPDFARGFRHSGLRFCFGLRPSFVIWPSSFVIFR